MSQLPSSSESSSLGGDDAPAPTVKAKSKKTPKRRATDDSEPASGGRGAGCVAALLNLLTAALLLLTVAGLALFLLLFQFPDVLRFVPGGSAYMPPTELPIAQALSSPTPVSAGSGQTFPTLPPVWTPTDTPTITPTPQPGTPSPEPSGTLPVPTYTATSTPTRTPTATRPSPTPAYNGPTPTASSTRSSQPYTLQPGSPAYLTNFLNDSGCNWFGVAGRAFGLDGNPVINLTVHLEGGSINVDVVTGSGPTAMGPGSYMIPLSDHPIDTTDIYKVQLRNNSGTPLSTIYSLNTFGNCAKNLIMVNFVQNH